MPTFKPIIVILGPTASGKSEMSIKIAKKFNGEIISADSRQIYKGMNIGTAKSLQIKNSKIKVQNDNAKFKIGKGKKTIIIDEIPHYLIDIIDPDEEFSVAEYKKLAVKLIKNIQKRGKLPFLVGGTALYLYAVINNLDFPRVPPSEKLRKNLERKPTEKLFEIYKKLDHEGAKYIDKSNKRRLIRAIEVCKATGKPFWGQRTKKKPLFDVLELGIKIGKKELKERISKRVEEMFKKGLESEVRNLVKKYGFDIPPLNTIGYQEWFSFAKTSEDKKGFFFTLTRSEKEKVKELIILHTFQFAKRQMTWFKRDRRISWIKGQKEAEKLIKKFLEIEKSRDIN